VSLGNDVVKIVYPAGVDVPLRLTIKAPKHRTPHWTFELPDADSFMKKALSWTFVLLLLVSCGERKDMLDSLQAYIDYLDGVGAYSSRIVKRTAKQDGYFVVSFYDESTNELFASYALNYKSWVKGTVIDAAWLDEAFENGNVIGVNDNGDGTYTDGSGHIYETHASTPKDLEKMAGYLESLKVKVIAEKMVANFGLSQERSHQIARLVSSYKKLSSNRKMSERDANYLTQYILGTSFNELENALNDQSELNQLLDIAAQKNGITPEHMGLIVSQMFETL